MSVPHQGLGGVIAQAHFDIHPSLATPGDIEFFVLTGMVYSLRVAEDDVTAVCIPNQKLFGKESLILKTFLLL